MPPRYAPFVGKQVKIAKAFELDIPAGCKLEYKLRKVGRKRERPMKNGS